MDGVKNPISRLQEICQQWKFLLPVYREAQGTFSEFGTEVTLTMEGETITAQGRGRTKKTSKSCAAQNVLDYVTKTKPHLLEPPPVQEVDDSAIVEAQAIWKKGSQMNRQHVPSTDHHELARETERLDCTLSLRPSLIEWLMVYCWCDNDQMFISVWSWADSYNRPELRRKCLRKTLQLRSMRRWW